ncbi:MAG: acyl carrier protein [Candidatus Muiribacterium halophilum]|uniref:Acyl carrier protein n=1 Tax=Muiribacterium halophilum TaxID=2053465 RepID=A0A2N5ZHC0_MUIH1|nr:MAG: acyl carrier protein [Candidatus Muirbacterium halophilum]
MDKSILLERLQNIMRNVFNDKELKISESSSAKDVEEWDSLTNIELIVAIEKEFDFRFTSLEVISLKNVGDLISKIEEKIS